MSRIPQETVDQIVRKADMVSIIGRTTALRRQGKNWIGLCPFHNERSPSFNVTPERGVFHCFGCKEGGGILQFLQKVDGTTFPETVKRLGAELGIEVRVEEDDDPAELRRKRLYEILERTARYYHDNLLRSALAADARAYLVKRGVSEATIARFRLGWAPASGNALIQQLERSGYTVEEGLVTGVLREKNGRAYDGLRARVTFPISDPTDRVIAFGGRTIDPEGQPKYLNTPETELYSKRNQLFGLSLHRQAIQKAEKAIVVEGYLDVVMMDQVGLPLGVASLGTALTPEQSRLLRKYTHDAVLAYDSDRAGQTATLKAIEIFEGEGLRAQIAVLPSGEDPDSVARNGGLAELERHLADSRSVIDYHIERGQERYDLSTPEGKEDFYREMMPVLDKIQNPVRQGSYVVKMAHLLGMSEERLSWRIKNRGQLQIVPTQRRQGFDALQSEPMLFRVCVHMPEAVEYVREQLALEELADEGLRALFGALLACPHEGVTLQDLLAHIEDPSLSKDLTQLLVDQPPESTLEDVQRLVKSIKHKHMRARLERLKHELVPELESGSVNPDDERYLEYIRLQKQLKGKS